MVDEIGSPALRTMIDCSAAGQAEAEPVRRADGALDADGPHRARAGERPQPARARPGRAGVRPILRTLLQMERLGHYRGVVAVEPFDYVPDGVGSAGIAIGYLRACSRAGRDG
jgi:hypothetical protein